MNKFILSGYVEDPGDTFFTIFVDNEVRIPVEIIDARVLTSCDSFSEGDLVEISGCIKDHYGERVLAIEDLTLLCKQELSVIDL